MTIEKIKLPKGRIVGGHPVKSEKKIDFKTKKPVLKDGLEIPQWRVEYAIPKDIFYRDVWPLMQKEAFTAYPWQQLLDPNNGLPLQSSDFSWKMVDGDSPLCPKGSKIPYNSREGYPGHVVLNLKTEAFAPGCFKFANGGYYAVTEAEVKVGDYLVANVDIRVHTENDGGLYINPNIFELVEIGQPIAMTGSANPEELLGAGGNATPGANLGAAAPAPQAGLPPVPGYSAAPAYAPQPGYAPQPAATMPPPAHDFVQNAGYAPQPGNYAPTAQQPMPQYAPQVAPGTVPVANPYPGNAPIPGLPQAR